MSAKYKVSVIIPIYNVAEYLEECLNPWFARQSIVWRSSWLMTALRISVE